MAGGGNFDAIVSVASCAMTSPQPCNNVSAGDNPSVRY
jgi:hypothetical protein